MNYEYKHGLYNKAKDRWGEKAQLIAAMEEFSEAAAAIARFLNGKCSQDKVIEELADVEIMSEQMRYYFSGTDINEIKEHKWDKLDKKLNIISEEDDFT